MNITEYDKFMCKQRDGKSYAYLAERVPTSVDAPYRIALVGDKIKPDDAVVLAFGGSGGGIIGNNWFAKIITNFIRENKALNDARIIVAICDFGEDYPEKTSRDTYNISKKHPIAWNFMSRAHHPLTTVDPENNEPLAAQDIFYDVIWPKVATPAGKRLPTNEMLKNMRGITIIAYCAGGHTAMFLEDFIKPQMARLGYSSKEIDVALNQIVVIGYAMNCPYHKSKMHFISFNSNADSDTNQDSFQRCLFLTRADFGLMHFQKNHSDTFLCTQISKAGVEGNPCEWVAIPIEEYLAKREQEAAEDHVESKDDTYNEHSFIGFVEKDGYSKGAQNLSKLFNTIITNTVANSIQNAKGSKFMPLPEMPDLVGEYVDIYGRADLVYFQQRTKNIIYAPAATAFYYGEQLLKFTGMTAWARNRAKEKQH